MTTGTLEFLGSTRFQVVRRLGAGANGIVYAVHDRERNEVVALKTMRWKDSSTIYLLKREFRSSAELAHPNLVTLHELIGDGEHWFFTMELVDGASFVDYVRQDGFQVERLRSALLQLAQAVHAIHGAGKVHRDLKPSNVLVTPGGRLVVLDFGISTDLDQADGHTTFDRKVVGTLAYMSPEQTEGIYAPSSDWYAIGVMLYEAMTGRIPFDGSIVEILWQKGTKDPVPPTVLVPGLPTDLTELCLQLLRRAPEERPSGEQILQRLGASPSSDEQAAAAVPPFNVALMGRESQLTELASALAAVGAGEAESVYVHGHSGIGKSALIEEFLQRFVSEDHALVLTGRCYVRESVPYKAMDGVIDKVSRFLRGLPDADADRLITPDMRILTLLFPVLEGVRAIAELPQPEQPIQDPVQLRRRGFAALRELFLRLTTLTPVVIYIDDLQWSDSESLVLLEDLLSPPSPPPILLIASFRSEDLEARPFLRALLERTRTTGYREIRLGPLTEADTRRLARTFAGAQADDAALIGAVVRESMGNPFLVEQLVRHALLTHDGPDADYRTLRVEDMLNARMAQLPVGARDFLETLAVAARPIDATVAYDAAELFGDKRALVRQLETERLLRRSGVPEGLELAHDWIRETIVSQIAGHEIQRCHLRLAEALEHHDIDDPEALYEHYTGAGQAAKAGAYAERAGERAERALAFDRAAELYQQAIGLATSDRLPQLWVRRASALADAGRGPEAATSYFEAAERHDGIAALDLRRRGAEQLLRSGHVDQGLNAVRTVLAAVGFRLARSPRHALIRLLYRRALMRLRGLRFQERSADAIEPFALSRIDVCWSVAIGLSRVDTIRAMDFQVLQLLLALRAGEPFRVSRALASEAGFLSTGGGRTRARAARLVNLTVSLAERINDARSLAFARFATGIADFYVGQFATAVEECEVAERLLRERCSGVVWEINTAQTFASSSLYYLGEYAELARRVPLRLREAKERGDLYAAADVTAGRPNIIWLVADDERAARDMLHASMSPWSLQGFHLQHYFFLLVEGQIDLYAGNAHAAWSRTSERWGDLKRSIVLRAQLIRLEALHLRARCAIAVADGDRSMRTTLLASAERDARRIQREHMPWANPLADLILAAINVSRGHTEDGLRLANRAVTAFDAARMSGYAAAARRRCGELTGGTQGSELIGAADAWFALQGVVNPARMTAMLAPGFPSD